MYEKIVSGKSIAEYLEKEGDVKAVTDINAVSARVRNGLRRRKRENGVCFGNGTR